MFLPAAKTVFRPWQLRENRSLFERVRDRLARDAANDDRFCRWRPTPNCKDVRPPPFPSTPSSFQASTSRPSTANGDGDDLIVGSLDRFTFFIKG